MKYISGHPEDATLLLDIKNRQSTLIPWDFQLANDYAEVDQIVDIEEYGGRLPAILEVFKEKISPKPKVGISNAVSYVDVQNLLDQVPEADIIFNPSLIDNVMSDLRATKSQFEISQMKESVKISNQLVVEIKDSIQSQNEIKTEMDLAVFVESRMRELGAFGVGFETLVASSKRSWQIHTYPRADPTKSFYSPGLALIDFGVKAFDLTSDVTLPFIMGKMNSKMKEIVETIQNAHDSAIDALSDSQYLYEVAEVAFDIIEAKGYTMPHGLGHGIGLTVHDSPGLRKKPQHETLLKDWKPSPIQNGMIITIEPGIYEKDVGGFRLENDVLIVNDKPQVLTNSEPVFIEFV
jgi:Xaa-Pro aminopeptidase